MATFMEGPSVTTLASAVAKLLDEGDGADDTGTSETSASPAEADSEPVAEESPLQTV
jgi:hypothetical protein